MRVYERIRAHSSHACPNAPEIPAQAIADAPALAADVKAAHAPHGEPLPEDRETESVDA